MKSSLDMPLLAVSWGEVFDKLTILQIKMAKISDPNKLKNIETELNEINKIVNSVATANGLNELINDLRQINEQLWDIEDGKRQCERDKDFGEKFIELARSVYFGNDKRAAIKKRINELLGSKIVEEKSYQAY